MPYSARPFYISIDCLLFNLFRNGEKILTLKIKIMVSTMHIIQVKIFQIMPGSLGLEMIWKTEGQNQQSLIQFLRSSQNSSLLERGVNV